MFDAASYYRHYEVSWDTVASHCRSWVGHEGAETLVDKRMMFGCKSAANWAQRGSGLLSWLAQQAIDRIVPTSPKIRRSMELLFLSGEAGESWRYSVGRVMHYIDDFPSVCAKTEVEPVEQTLAALWKTLGFEPQSKKVWFEGEYRPT